MKIFVSGASGIVGYGIIRSLKMADSDFRIVASSNREISPANVFADDFFLAPSTESPGYLNWLEEFLDRERPEIAIPGIEADNVLWNQQREIFSRSGVKPLLNDYQLIETCRDKWSLFLELRRIAEETTIDTVIATDFDEIVSLFGLPFIVKPRRGYGGQGFQVISERDQFLRGIKPDFIAQPYVGDISREFTVSGYGDGRGGVPHIFAMRRTLDSAGFTSVAEVVDSSPFIGPIRRIASHLRPFGPTNFQFREEGDKIFLLEINPRISSSTSIRSGFGFNETAMAVKHLSTGRIETPLPAKAGLAIRYVEDYFLQSTNIPKEKL